MRRLSQIVQDYRDTGAMSTLIKLSGFVATGVFLTKGGDLGVVLALCGVDYAISLWLGVIHGSGREEMTTKDLGLRTASSVCERLRGPITNGRSLRRSANQRTTITHDVTRNCVA
jgi:hypothetical protein